MPIEAIAQDWCSAVQTMSISIQPGKLQEQSARAAETGEALLRGLFSEYVPCVCGMTFSSVDPLLPVDTVGDSMLRRIDRHTAICTWRGWQLPCARSSCSQEVEALHSILQHRSACVCRRRGRLPGSYTRLRVHGPASPAGRFGSYCLYRGRAPAPVHHPGTPFIQHAISTFRFACPASILKAKQQAN